MFFQYYRFPTTSPIPPGFYVVRILRNPAGQWVAQIRNLQGRVVKEEDGVIVESHQPMGRIFPSLDISAQFHHNRRRSSPRDNYQGQSVLGRPQLSAAVRNVRPLEPA